jgi:sterol 3beta-glucosyltransferase
MGPPENSKLRESLGRKLTKRKAPPRRVSMDVPERLRGDDDAQDDVTATTSGRYMNQSIFSMITAAGSTADFQSRFDEPESESEDEDTAGGNEGLSQTVPALSSVPTPSQLDSRPISTPAEPKHQRSSSKSRLITSMKSHLRLKPIRERKNSSVDDDPMSASQLLPARSELAVRRSPEPISGEAPMLSRILKAEAEAAEETAYEVAKKGQDEPVGADSQPAKSDRLAQRLMEIFGFDEPEEVISEWPCWLLQSVLVQGFMYVTQKHVCFFAYLPKKAVSYCSTFINVYTNLPKTTVTKSGYLSKRGLHNPRYNRYYVQLKGDVLSYYEDPSKIYYPSGQIDLRLGIGASLKDKSKDNCYFVLTTNKREYMFKADSPASAKDWIKLLQKVIFRSHNEGDSIKVSLPIENIMDIEHNQVLDFANTVKIRVIDNDETYAIDEVCQVH